MSKVTTSNLRNDIVGTRPERQGGGARLKDNAPRSSEDPDRRTDGLPQGERAHDPWEGDRSATSPQSDPDVNDGNARPTQGKV